MEPYESAVAHIHVSGLMTQMAGHHIRVEALQQPTRRPMIYFAPETYGSSLSGLFSAGLIDMNRMAHQVDIKTGKFVGSTPSNHNQYLNAAFRNVQQSTGSVTDIPFWITTVSPSAAASRLNVTVANELQILEDHNVLRLQIPPQTTLRLKALEHPQPKRAALYRGVAFGMYVRYVTVPADWSVSKIYATFDPSQTSVTTSLVHPAASTDWHFVSMRGDLPASSASAGSVAIYTEFVFENMDSMESLCVEITLPSFAWGEQTPQLESTPLSSAGGKMFGTLSTSAVSVLPPASGNYYVFPKDGNVYIIAPTAHIYPTMSRLNYAGAERFAEGTVITILFLVSGVTIADGPYIDIISSFTSNSHCSITLLARDAGTWIELSRSGIA
ncbi:unnamed protein product [Symbiodinium microadriaticum]|nr:unnamed protein product [Symbiodinium microadriaticum]